MYVIAQSQNAQAITIAAGAATNAFNVVAGEPGAGTQLNLNVPGSNRVNGQGFRVRANGLINVPAATATLAAANLSFALYGSNTVSFAAASGNLLFSTVAIVACTISAATAVSYPFQLELETIGGGTVLSSRSNYINTTPVGNGSLPATSGPTAVTANQVTAINWQTEPPLQFAAAIISGAANNYPVGTTVTLNEFVIEA
jgi:hypothetical protein